MEDIRRNRFIEANFNSFFFYEIDKELYENEKSKFLY